MAMDLKLIAAGLRHCGKLQAFKRGESIQAQLIKQGISNNVFLANNLISMHLDFRSLVDAQKLFDEMTERNIVTWTTMVSGYTSHGKPNKAIELYRSMLLDSESEPPNEFLFSAVLKACGLAGDLQLGRLIHERIGKENMKGDVVLMNAVLDMYVKNRRVSEADKAFSEISQPNLTSWNTLVSGYCKEGLVDEAVGLFRRIPKPNDVSWNCLIFGFVDKGSPRALEFLVMMHREGFKLDGFALPCGLKACSLGGLSTMGKQLHCCVLKSGLESSPFALSALIDMYSNCCSLRDAVDLFGQANLHCSTVAVWNSMLSGFLINDENEAALGLLLRMYQSGLSFDSYTLSGALKICINVISLRLGRQVHGLVVISGYELDYIVGSILVDLHANVGDVKDAHRLFHRLPNKDIIAFSGLIRGCVKAGFYSLAFDLFRELIKLGLDADQFIISSILKACSSLASLGWGKQIHGLCVKKGYESEPVTATGLIDTYVKCGDIDNGVVLFDGMLERDVVSWTGIIVGCGQNGRAKEAIQYFREMIDSGVEPNEVTFYGVLSACRHSGLLEEARLLLESMKSEYGLEPCLEHYYCVVDLLGQAGRFQEAEEIINEMPFEPDKTIWMSLITACGTHKNDELVTVIAEKLLNTFPEDPSVYTCISNVYAMMGMWDRLSEVREAAKKLGTKESGLSWIDIA